MEEEEETIVKNYQRQGHSEVQCEFLTGKEFMTGKVICGFLGNAFRLQVRSQTLCCST